MINVYLYLDNNKDAQELAKALLKAKLVGHVSIDSNNKTLLNVDGHVIEQISSLITAQTKAMLFNSILDYVSTNYHDTIKIFSVPITQCNDVFGNIIREETEKV
jgi:uncharacterized protein involved in tolerance to divalent cations